MMIFNAAIVLYFSLSQGHASVEVLLPNEIFTFSKLSQEVRGHVALKIQEMIKTYGPNEIQPGRKIIFQDAAQKTKASIEFERSLQILPNSEMHRSERVTILGAREEMLLSEDIETFGKGLRYTTPRVRVYFEGDLNYGLDPGETKKIVNISSNNRDLFRFISVQSQSLSGEIRLQYDLIIGGSKVVTITDTENAIHTHRILQYEIFKGQYSVAAFGYFHSSSDWSTEPFRIEAIKPPNYLVENYTFFQNGERVFVPIDFFKELSKNVYQKFVLNGISSAISSLVEKKFPDTHRSEDITLQSPFLTDLKNVLNLVETAKVNPAVLSQLSSIITSFISALRDGTLKVIDLRPNSATQAKSQ